MQVKAQGVNRSLMERCVTRGRGYRKLDLQYRMHPLICSMISSMFYAPHDCSLKTDREIAALRNRIDNNMFGAARNATCLWWHDTDSLLDSQEQRVGRSFQNVEEAKLCRQLYERERQTDGNPRPVHIIAM